MYILLLYRTVGFTVLTVAGILAPFKIATATNTSKTTFKALYIINIPLVLVNAKFTTFNNINVIF